MAELVQTAANVVKGTGARTQEGVGGATLTAGMPVFKDTADGNQLKGCRANAAGTANCDGILLNGCSDSQPGVYQSHGQVNLGATLVVGETYCVSDLTAGKIVPIGDLGTADYVTILGVAITAALLELDIQNSGIAKP